MREQQLRENAHRVDQTIYLQGQEAVKQVEEYCRCGATFEISVEELAKILDYALFECENCSLCLKVILNTNFCCGARLRNLYIDLVSYGCFVFEDIGLGLDFLLD